MTFRIEPVPRRPTLLSIRFTWEGRRAHLVNPTSVPPEGPFVPPAS